MKRDMELIRTIALATADLPYGDNLRGLPDVSDEQFATHVAWMLEAGLVKATCREGNSAEVTAAFVFRLTWSGCEFADAVRNDSLWNKARTSVIRPGLSFTFDILRDWLKAEIAQGLPALRALS